MSRIVTFDKCIARPGSRLDEHLTAVKQSMEHFLQDFGLTLSRLSGLAGICHDLAKSHADWQAYIQSPASQKGPNHAACGAFLFSYAGYHLLEKMHSWEEHQIEWLWFIHDIKSHHGQLGDLFNEDWLKKYEWDRFDLHGIEHFLKTHYEELEHFFISKESLINWIEECRYLLEDIYDTLDLEYEDWEPLPIMKRLQTWRQLTTSLIAGDRFHVKDITMNRLNNEDYDNFQESLREFSSKHAGEPLTLVRINAQENIIRQLQKQPNHMFYTVEMPTGYGKTITALKMAKWLGETQGLRKIVYVAPYLSILEQTSSTIESLFREKVLEHHSLAILDEDPNQRVGFSQLAMESWAHSLVCTSFQQFSRAIFPKRSQDVLRRSFLKNTVVIIDEPQIFSPDIWNLFLCGLEALGELINLKVIFLSATMPPFHFGISKTPVNLVVKGSSDNDRFKVIIQSQKQDEEKIVDLMEKRERETQALILNTIKDAYLSYKNLTEKGKSCHLIHGLMTPMHKKALIKKIRCLLEKKNEVPLYVVSTQILEAGVNLSFEHIGRALPILPSIVQTAGRVNRHKESDQLGCITVFPFYRNGELDTRSMIYPKYLQKLTDQILERKKEYTESKITSLVKEYYEEMFRQNTYEAALTRIKDAYEGRWQHLADIHPFSNEYMKLPIFVPYEPRNEWIDEKVHGLKKQFKVKHPLQIYEKYSDRHYMNKLSFVERKMFMILFNYYVLNVPIKTALSVVSKDDYLQKRVPILLDTDAYDETLGLKAGLEEDDSIW